MKYYMEMREAQGKNRKAKVERQRAKVFMYPNLATTDGMPCYPELVINETGSHGDPLALLCIPSSPKNQIAYGKTYLRTRQLTDQVPIERSDDFTAKPELNPKELTLIVTASQSSLPVRQAGLSSRRESLSRLLGREEGESKRMNRFPGMKRAFFGTPANNLNDLIYDALFTPAPTAGGAIENEKRTKAYKRSGHKNTFRNFDAATCANAPASTLPLAYRTGRLAKGEYPDRSVGGRGYFRHTHRQKKTEPFKLIVTK